MATTRTAPASQPTFRTRAMLTVLALVALAVIPAPEAGAATARAGATCKTVGSTVTVSSGRLRCQSVRNTRGRTVKVWVRMAPVTTTTVVDPWPASVDTTPVTTAPAAPGSPCGAPALETRLAGVPISARIGSLSGWINSIEGFFLTELTRVGQRYCPPLQYVAQSNGSTAGCGARVQAAFCYDQVAVAWDAEDFAPRMVNAFGEAGFALVLAHENGHLAQNLLDRRPSRPIHLELQADCFSGAWLRSAVDQGRVPRSEVARAVAISLAAADSPGLTSIDDRDAHGSGFDRIGALQDGYSSGVSRCIGYASSPPAITARLYSLSELLSVHENDLRTTLDLGFRSLNALLSGLSGWTAPDRYIDYRNAASLCRTRLAGAGFTDGAAAFCSRDLNGRAFVAVDVDKLADISEYYGDTAALAILGYVWLAGGLTLGQFDETPYVLQTDCWIGAWFRGEEQTRRNFSLYPGDMDEVIGGLLSLRTGGDAFARVASLQTGYLQGIESCRRYAPTTTGTTGTSTTATTPTTRPVATTPATTVPTATGPRGTITLVRTGVWNPNITGYTVDVLCLGSNWSTTFPQSGGVAQAPPGFGGTCTFRVTSLGPSSDTVYVSANGQLLGNGTNGNLASSGSVGLGGAWTAIVTIAG